MRIFLAIDLPKEVKEYIYNIQPKIKDAKITWVSKKNLHLTLKFFGEVNESQLKLIKDEIKIRTNGFSITLDELGFFPDERNPRVIWVGLHPEDKIIRLQQQIDELFLSDFPSDQKFQSHITIGRIKSIRRKEDFLKSLKLIQIKPMEFKINSLKLMKSELTKLGPAYETLEEISLP